MTTTLVLAQGSFFRLPSFLCRLVDAGQLLVLLTVHTVHAGLL